MSGYKAAKFSIFGLTLKVTILEALDPTGSAVSLGTNNEATAIPCHISPHGVFEFRTKTSPCAADDEVTNNNGIAINKGLVYSTPLAYGIYGNIFELLFGNRAAVRFIVGFQQVGLLTSCLEVLTGELNVRREVERMSSLGWFKKLEPGCTHFRQRQNYYFGRPEAQSPSQNDKLFHQKIQSSIMGGASSDDRSSSTESVVVGVGGCSEISQTVTIITLLDSDFPVKLPPESLTQISLRLSSKDGMIFRFSTRPVAGAVGGGRRDLPPMTLVYSSPIAVAIYARDKTFEVLFENLKAVRFQLEESPGGGLDCFKRGILGAVPDGDCIPSWISEMQGKGWLNGAIHCWREGQLTSSSTTTWGRRQRDFGI